MKNFIFFFLFLILGFSNYAQCPWNRVNCSHGCGRHFDENGDGYCDYSIIEKPIITKVDSINKQEVKNDKIVTKNDSTLNNQKIKKPVKPSIINSALDEKLKDSAQIEKISSDTTKNISIQKSTTKVVSKPYSLIFISLLTLFLYGITFTLSKVGKLKVKYHRRIWNILLLITFLVSCLFGFFLVIQINYQLAIDWLRTILYWHVQVGISMTIIAVFHIFWHINYFSKVFKK